MGLKLSQKVLILVAVPVLFEIGLVWLLAHLRFETELQRSQESHSQQLVSHFDTVLELYLQRGSLLVLGHYNPSEILHQRVQSTTAKVHSELENIKTLLTHGDAKEQKDWQSLIALAYNLDEGFIKAKDSFDKGDQLTAAQSWIKYQHYTDKMFGIWNRLVLEQQNLQEQRHATLAELERLLDVTLCLAVLVSIALAFGLAIFFNLSTSRRLYKIAENTSLVAAGRAPQHKVGGDDELSTLDNDIHNLHSALELMRRKDRAVLNNAAEIICTIDQKYKFVDINRAVEDLWQYEASELLGRRLLDLVVEAEKDRIFAELEKAQLIDAASTFNCTIKKSDGQSVDSAWSITWSSVDKMFYCVVHDISERVRVEKMKRDFVAMVSHDLRTPLTTVQLVHEFLYEELSGAMSEFARKKLLVADNGIRRLMALVNNLLDLERLEAGRMDIIARPSNLSVIVQESIDAVASIAGQKQLQVVSSVSDAIMVEVDPDRIVQVIVNLLSNALKYAPAQSAIVISAVNAERSVKVGITDQGPGISVENQTLLFDRFKQLSRDDERVHKGSGLGLSICKWIVESHGGEIGLDSTIGKGSTFWFTLTKSQNDSHKTIT